MSETATETNEHVSGIGWTLVALITVAISFAIAETPNFTGNRTVDRVGFGLAISGLLIGSIAVFLQSFDLLPSRTELPAAIIAVAGFTPLMLTDDRWSITTFAVYAVCFSLGIRRGIWLAGYVSVIWALSLLGAGAPIWALIIPLGVFGISSILSATIERDVQHRDRQTTLISELRAIQTDLADSERSKGVLAERARVAAEIHDTLAQGFTSVVLLSRAGIRSGDDPEALRSTLKSIEETAQENLGDARRLIAAIQPPELNTGSLPMALERQLESVLPETVEGDFRLVGEPRALTGAVEVTVLRAAQEALLNVRTHAKATRVDMVLSYAVDSVNLDVADNGIGFEMGHISDRGDLTGGQGLALLKSRAESLFGHLDLRPGDGGGSLMSLQLPVGME